MSNGSISSSRVPGGRRAALAAFGLSFAFFCLIMWCAPYSSDDLEFATLPYTTFGEYLTFVLEYGNGRLLGNLCSILLSKVRWLCVLVKAAVMASTVVLLPAVLGLAAVSDYLLSFLLVTTVEPAVFGEAYVWTSGFSNYMPPIWMALVILVVLRAFPRLGKAAQAAACLGIFLLGVAAQLFIEHSSGVNLLLAMSTVAVCLYRRDKSRLVPGLVWLVAAALGLGLMLAIPVLFHIEGNHTDTYRSVQLGGIAAIVVSCAKNAIQLSNHHFGSCTLPMCLSAFGVLHMTRGRRGEKSNRILFWLNAVSFAYLLLNLLLSQADYLGKGAIVQHIISTAFALIPYGVWVAAALALEDRALRSQLLAILGFALVSLLPLLVVSPIPTRVVLQAHIFVMLGTLLCLRQILGLLPQGWTRVLAKGAAVTALTLVVLLSSIFVSIRHLSQIREDHIRQELASGASEIVIFALPYEYTSWDHLWGQKYYNDTGRDVTFSSISYTMWMNDIYR